MDGICVLNIHQKRSDYLSGKRIKQGNRYMINSLVSDLQTTVDSKNKCVVLNWKSDIYGIKRIFRKNNSNNYNHISSGDDVTFIDRTDKNQLVDYKIGNNQHIHYQIESSTSCDYTYSLEVVTNWTGWSISSLIPQGKMDNMPIYNIGATWNFICDVDSGGITNNINSQVHNGTSAYPQTSRGNTIYESGSFSAKLLTLKCPNLEIVDNIQRVKQWTKFITENNIFLLKSHKGDVWVVSISDNPLRSYQEATHYNLTTITYNWVEVEDLNKIIVR